MASNATAAVLVISNDVLSGKRDFNSYISLQLSLMPDWTINKFVVLPRDERIIKCEIELVWKLYDIVIITDETCSTNVYVATIIASVFNEGTYVNSNLYKALKHCGGIEDKRQAEIAKPSKLLTCYHDHKYLVPVVSLHRVFLLKGTASNIVATFNDILKPYLNDFSRRPVFKKKFYFNLRELDIDEIKKLCTDNVTINIENTECSIVVVASSDRFNKILEMEKTLLTLYGEFIKRRCIEDISIFDSFYYQSDTNIREAVEIIEDCLTRYGHENIFISFNGGKDCTVLLHLVLAVLKRLQPDYCNPVLCWYVRSPNAFPEQDEFIVKCQTYYNLEILTMHTNIKDGLEEILKQRPNLKACFMGTRRTDPYSGNLRNFQITDSDWPQVMRVFPLLDWHYSHIWDYLLYFKVPYCSLYDIGYTSLGNVENTIKNPSLLWHDVLQEKKVYLPAYKLLESEKERNGRLT